MGQLENMQVFVRIVEAGSISRAAEQLNLAKSAVSRRLSELEQLLGSSLINRTTRASSLTQVGREYYNRALVLLDEFNELHCDVGQAQQTLQGKLKLAVPVTFGLTHLSAALAEFNKAHPQLALDVDFSDRKVDLIEEGFDMAFRIADLEDSNFQARKISQINSYIVASPAYIQASGALNSVEDLHQHQILKYSGNKHRKYTIFDPHGERKHYHFDAHVVANNGDFLRQMAVAGRGIAILPSFIVAQSLQVGELQRVLPGYSLPSINAYVVYPSSKFLSRRARVFIDFLVDWFGESPAWEQPQNKKE